MSRVVIQILLYNTFPSLSSHLTYPTQYINLVTFAALSEKTALEHIPHQNLHITDAYVYHTMGMGRTPWLVLVG